MKTPIKSPVKRQAKIDVEKAWANAFAKYHWPNGFVCAKCGETSAWFFSSRRMYQCSKCRHQVYATTVGILLDLTNLYYLKDYLGGLYCRINHKLEESEQTTELMAKKMFLNKKFIWLMAAVAAYSMYIAH